MKKKLIGALVLLLSMVLMVPSVFAASDLPKDHRFYEEITYLMDKGIVSGYLNGTVQPDQLVTRAEAAIMIARLKGFSGAPQETKFTDVPKDHPASGYIAEAVKAGLLSGYPGDVYKPEAPIIRGDMAMIVKRLFDLGLMTNWEFKDVSSNMKAYDAVQTMLLANITIGYPDETFRPNMKVTRGQFSAFLARGMEPKFKNDATIPNSYLRDKTKVYVLESAGEQVTHTYKMHTIDPSLPEEFMWVLENNVTGKIIANVESETYDSYSVGFPYSESFTDLAYPVETGKEFVYKYLGLYDKEMRTITGVNKTVATKYKTFTNATEVTDAKGTKHYYVEGHGKVKSVQPSGAVFELVDIR
ncbi:S-layer homology domain-containing protein [Planococcus sp. FY231025]|uniref:S-layer homology domain-containing protein n=1 Tax=Planococcus sp. FY231025 TaxID=3455699 RepID=UPI003F9181B8